MKRAVIAVLLTCAALGCLAAPALGADAYPGMEHLHFAAGPYRITPGANLILLDTNQVPKPAQDGYIVRMAPNLRYARPGGKCCGGIPRVDVIHLHHGVWLSNGAAGEGEGNGLGGLYPFMASGEEKTVYEFPHGFGYPVGASDVWILNYMIHNLTSKAAQVYITYDLDFVPATVARRGADHAGAPDLDGRRGSPHLPGVRRPPPQRGQREVHLPRHGQAPLRRRRRRSTSSPSTIPARWSPPPATCIPAASTTTSTSSDRPPSRPAGPISGTVPDSVRLFRSNAHYFDKRGPISWDMAMTATPADWRPQVKAGDVLRISSTYNTTRASWYESMGIMVVWEAWNTRGRHRPLRPSHRRARPRHPRPPGRGQQPRRRLPAEHHRRRLPRLLAPDGPDLAVPVRPRRLHRHGH